MILHTLSWYRVKGTRQFCQVTGIASTANPQILVQKADKNLKRFHTYLLWFTSTSEDLTAWTKRAILMELDKALRLLREPAQADLAIIETLKSISKDIPLSSMSVDGVKTKPLPEKESR